jgi:hypothetical protein
MCAVCGVLKRPLFIKAAFYKMGGKHLTLQILLLLKHRPPPSPPRKSWKPDFASMMSPV